MPSANSRAVPTILITGFLGSGKTTFLNELLKWAETRGMRAVAIVNEFGRAGVDARLLSAHDMPVYEVASGSIFCACTRGQFLKALEAAANAEPPAALLAIEATGLADPADISSYLALPPLAGRLVIAANLCLCDAVNFHKIERTLAVAPRQVAQASALILNKCDCTPPEQVAETRALLRHHNPSAEIIETSFGRADFDAVLAPRLSAAAGSGQHAWKTQSPLADSARALGAESATLLAPGALDRAQFMGFLDGLPPLLRAKGIVRFDDSEADWLIERSHAGWNVSPLSDRKARNSFLVLFAQSLDSDLLQDRFLDCAAYRKENTP